ncbi:uncharacterized protein LOC129761047 [Uranotaenia lowii]|uniref:uncharacterized protein LOC129761047 n=1 Tax=Uranotaenia lowii TaxID=190385 RepID=UPI002479699C|nr:uncharacterized protein LOC129761047 [Uranotaenia lowii]
MAKLVVIAALLLVGINGWLRDEGVTLVKALDIGYELIAAMLDTLNANMQKANKLSQEQFNTLKAELASIQETVRIIESRTKENFSINVPSNENNETELVVFTHFDEKNGGNENPKIRNVTRPWYKRW